MILIPLRNITKELPRTLKKILIHLLGISTKFSNVDRTIKWFSGLNATDQRKQAKYWNYLPRLMKKLYKNNINVFIKQQQILKQENETKKRGRPSGYSYSNETLSKKRNTVSHSPTAAERQHTQSDNNELNGLSLEPSSVVLLESTTTTTSPSKLVTSTSTAATAAAVSAIPVAMNSTTTTSTIDTNMTGDMPSTGTVPITTTTTTTTSAGGTAPTANVASTIDTTMTGDTTASGTAAAAAAAFEAATTATTATVVAATTLSSKLGTTTVAAAAP